MYCPDGYERVDASEMREIRRLAPNGVPPMVSNWLTIKITDELLAKARDTAKRNDDGGTASN